MKLILTSVLALSLAAQTINQVNPASASQFDAETIARNLETPWAMAFAPDGRMFITERPGRIRVVERDVLNPSPWAVIPVNESAQRGLESGLMGLAIDPQFARNRRVYVCYTHAGAGSTSNRIGVLTEEKGKGTNLTV